MTPCAWPAKSPDPSCLDYCFWGDATVKLTAIQPEALGELERVVSAFVAHMTRQEVLRAVRHVLMRADARR